MATDDRDSTQGPMDLSDDAKKASGTSGGGKGGGGHSFGKADGDGKRGAGSEGGAVGGGAKKTLYLIDTSGFVFRAYHALPPFTNVIAHAR